MFQFTNVHKFCKFQIIFSSIMGNIAHSIVLAKAGKWYNCYFGLCVSRKKTWLFSALYSSQG